MPPLPSDARAGLIRPARVDEVDALNALTGRSCLHWGYEPAFLDWEPHAITVYPEMLDGVRAQVLQEEEGRVVGYYVLTGELAAEATAEPPTLHLDKLFVDADRIGTGRGKRLWLHAVETARALGAVELAFAADPNAAPFYRAMGADWESEETTSRPGWKLQHFRFPIPPGRLPTSEEQLHAVTLGGPAVHDAPIDLAEYDPAWPVLFQREAARIRAVLGERVLLLEHVGSTSVPGLCAKPILDLLLVVADSADEPAYVPPMEAAGYPLRIREPDWHEHRLFKGLDPVVNIHVFSAGSPEIGRMLAFRDHLRADAADRDLYADAKRDLAARTWHYVQNYADAKTDIVGAIISRAAAARRQAAAG